MHLDVGGAATGESIARVNGVVPLDAGGEADSEALPGPRELPPHHLRCCGVKE